MERLEIADWAERGTRVRATDRARKDIAMATVVLNPKTSTNDGGDRVKGVTEICVTSAVTSYMCFFWII